MSSPYSKTPLAKKLGIKAGFKISLINPPAYYYDLFIDMPDNIEIITDKTIKKDFIHYFATAAKELQADILSLKNEIKQNGIIWISWCKKVAKIPTDVTEDFIRNTSLANGLVDIKVCAVDEIWSGLKLVIPLKDRVGNSKMAGKLSSETAEAMQKHVEESRNEWEERFKKQF